MLIRRAFYRWQFLAAIFLPVWLLIGFAIYGSGSGWGILALLLVVPIAFITLGVVALIIAARPEVRLAKAVSWVDVAVLAVWHGLIIATGFYGPSATTFAILAIVGAIAAFWISIWQLFGDSARRVKATMSEFERLAAQQQREAMGPDAAPGPFEGGNEEIIVIHERTETTERSDRRDGRDGTARR
jgi:hypothetical protein